jgi:hypothetical protein
MEGQPLPPIAGFRPYSDSCAHWRDSLFLLAELADAQQVLVELGKGFLCQLAEELFQRG